MLIHSLTMSGDLGFIQYEKAGAKERGSIAMYWYPPSDTRGMLMRLPKAAVVVRNWQRMKVVLPKTVVFLGDIRKEKMKFLEVKGVMLTGEVKLSVNATRTTLWQYFGSMKDPELVKLFKELLEGDSLMNIAIVCTGTTIGVMQRLARLRLTRHLDSGKVQFGPDFEAFVREKWPWQIVDPLWFFKAESGAKILSMLPVTGTSDAGPGYYREDAQKGWIVMKKGDAEAQDKACKIVDYLLEEFRKGRTILDILKALPELFVAQLKHKNDYHDCQDLFGEDIYGRKDGFPKTRPYFAFQFHHTLLFSTITHLISSSQRNYQVDPTSWSMIGHTWMHGGTEKLWRFLNAEGEYDNEQMIHCLFYGDDAVYRFLLNIGGCSVTFVWCPDVAGMDFTLTRNTTLDFSRHALNRFLKSLRTEGLDIQALLPKEWRAVIEMWGLSAVSMPFVYIGKHVVQLLNGLRSGVSGTTLFDEYQSFRIFYVIKDRLEKALKEIEAKYKKVECDDHSVKLVCAELEAKLKNISSWLKTKFGIEIKEKTMGVYETDAFEECKFFPGKVSPYTILGFRLTRVGESIVPVKAIDDIFRSLVKPRGNYKNGVVADMAELERVRAMAISGGWLYPEVYKFLVDYFRMRRTRGKIQLNPKELGKPVTVDLYPLSSIPEELHQKFRDEDFAGLLELGDAISCEEEGWTDLVGVEMFKRHILGDPDWFPSPAWIADLYAVPVETVQEMLSFDIVSTSRAIEIVESAAGGFDTTVSWSAMVEEDEEAKQEELQARLVESGVAEERAESVRITDIGGEVVASLAAPAKTKPTERDMTPKTTVISVGATSANDARIRELEKQLEEMSKMLRSAGFLGGVPPPRINTDDEHLEEKPEKATPKASRKPTKPKTLTVVAKPQPQQRKRTPKRGSRSVARSDDEPSLDVSGTASDAFVVGFSN